MAAGAFTFFNTARKWLTDGSFDLNADTITWALINSSYAPLLTHTVFADVSANELATAFGYSRAARLTSVLSDASWDKATDPTKPKIIQADLSWLAAGGTITAKWLLAFKNATVTTDLGSTVNPLLGFLNLDNSGASADGYTTPGPSSVSATAGNTLKIAWPAGLLAIT